MHDGRKLTTAEIRELRAQIGKIELIFLNIEQETFSSAVEFKNLCEYFDEVSSGDGGFQLTKDQTELVYLAVRFVGLCMHLTELRNRLHEATGE